MVVRLQSRWVATVVLGGLGAFELAVYRSGAGVVLAGIFCVAIVIAFRMRLTADDSGVTIVNYGLPHPIAWSEIEGFRMGRHYFANCLEVRLVDGGRARARAVTTSGAAAYSFGEANAIVAELRGRLAAAHGDDPAQADARALEEALSAAERRDYGPLVELAVDERIDPEELGRRVDELVEQGRIDRRAYERSLPPPPKFSWWMKIFLSRKMRELVEEVEQDDSDLRV